MVCRSVAFIVCVYLVPFLCLGRAPFICILFLFRSFLYASIGVGGWWFVHLRWGAVSYYCWGFGVLLGCGIYSSLMYLDVYFQCLLLLCLGARTVGVDVVVFSRLIFLAFFRPGYGVCFMFPVSCSDVCSFALGAIWVIMGWLIHLSLSGGGGVPWEQVFICVSSRPILAHARAWEHLTTWWLRFKVPRSITYHTQ